MSKQGKQRTRIKQFILTFTPFFILTLLFIGLNFWPGWLKQLNQPALTEIDSTTVVEEVREPGLVEIDQGQENQVGLATAVVPTPTSQPTPSPQPTLPPDATITLNGPPEGSSFPSTSTITFYWDWPLLLAENQQFTLSLTNGDQEHQIATVNDQNLGRQYAATVDLGSIEQTPESSLSWQIKLIDSDSGTILAQSERRKLMFISQATQR